MGINTAVRNAYFNNLENKKIMSVEEFKKWLKKFGKNESDPISELQLQRAILDTTRGWFSKRKAKRAMKEADSNNNGLIDDNEIVHLRDFAARDLGIKLVN
ncbi:Uncharacterized protein Adt_19841 [Abeliophyllum distichum]|uniref:EF-hand domain-containing protein n=1 Tax=Abeliophyllum distichum TaxID=126358 RepID=A0ABD1SU31_9LAMI